MFRKIAIAVSAVLLGLVIVWNFGYAQVMANRVVAWLDSKVSVDTKIEHVEIQVGKIDNEIRANIANLAKMEAEKDQLEQRIVVLKETQAKTKTEMASLTKVLDSNDVKVSLRERDNRTTQLETLVNTYKVNDRKLKGLEELLAAKQQTFEAAHKKIADMKSQRDGLQVTIENLKSRKEVVDLKLQQCQTPVSDSGALNKVNGEIKQINDELTQKEKYADKLNEFGYGNNPQATPEKNAKSVKDVVGAAKAILDQGDSDK